MTERPKLPLPTGLIGQAEPVRFDTASARPFFPFLSAAHMFLCLAIYVVITGAGTLAIMLAAPRAWMFVAVCSAVGSAAGMLPSLIGSAPARVTVRTPNPELWADFTRQWAAASRYNQQDNETNLWLRDAPFWMKWPGESIRLRIGENKLEVTGKPFLMRQLKRNFDRITAHGHRWSEDSVSSSQTSGNSGRS
jgi:hypothetical protein